MHQQIYLLIYEKLDLNEVNLEDSLDLTIVSYAIYLSQSYMDIILILFIKYLAPYSHCYNHFYL